MAKDDTQKKLLKVKPRPVSVVIPSSSMEPTEPIEESIDVSKSWFQRILDSKFVTAIFKLSDKAGKKWEKFEDESIMYIWGINCSIYMSYILSYDEDSSYNILIDILKNSHRVLKPNGKIILALRYKSLI